MGRSFRTLAVICVALLVTSVLLSPVAQATTDGDGDGLSDAYETSTLYRQRADADGLPAAMPPWSQLNSTVTLQQWAGLVDGAYANFTLDHPRTGDVTAQVGHWNGTAWGIGTCGTPGPASSG